MLTDPCGLHRDGNWLRVKSLVQEEAGALIAQFQAFDVPEMGTPPFGVPGNPT